MRKRIQKDDSRRQDAPRGGRSSARNFGDKSTGPDRPAKPRAPRADFDGPKRSFDGDRKPYNRDNVSDRPYSPRAPREGGDRPYTPRAPRGDSDRPYTPRAPRGDSDRPYTPRAPRGDGDRPYTPRAPREGGDRPYTPRAPREDGDRPYTPRAPRGDGDRPYTPRAPRGDGDRPYTPRAPREGGDRPYTPRAPREDGDRPYTPRAPREDGDRPYTPRAPRGDSDRPYTPRAPREDGDRPYTPRAPREDGDRPYTPRAPREDGDRPYTPRADFDRAPRDENRESKPFGPREDNPRASKFSKRDTFKSRNRHDESPAYAPSYKLDRYKERAPAKIQKRIAQTERRSDEVRLNRFIANAGICSRRDADKLIEAGEIKVNNKVITEMGYQVMPTDVVKYGNRRLNREKPAYVLLNKPKDFLTTTEDPGDRKTVMELVKNAGDARIYPVGRLDRNTTGLLLLTNDGELADKLTHPSNEIEKIYQAELDKPLTDEDFEKIKAGLTLEDGEIKIDDLAKVTPDGYVIGVKIHSGKNRIVRRIFEHLGYEVTKLDRTTFAGLTKKDLPRGSWRYLTERELVKLKYLL